MSTTANAAAAAEKKIQDHIGYLFESNMYAAFADIAANWEHENPYPSDSYQSYENFTKDKKVRLERKAIFKLSTEVKQANQFFFKRFCAEAKNAPLEDNDGTDAVVQKIEEANDDALTPFMYRIQTEVAGKIGATLKSVVDPTRALEAEITNQMGKQLAAPLKATLAGLFENFLKSVAYLCAWQMWIMGNSMSFDALLAVFALRLTDGPTFDTIKTCLPEKTPSKPKAKSATASATTSATTSPAPTTPATPATAPVTNPPPSEITAALQNI